MRFDDRLLTVLSQPVGTPHDKAVRWRQLVDLVARSGPHDDSPALARALDEIRDGAAEVDEPLRAAAARAVAALPIPLGLLEIFAQDSLAVSAPVLAAARIEDADWRSLAARVEPGTLRFLEAVHPGIAAGPPEPELHVEQEPTALAQAPPSRPPGRSLADVVARIERRRKRRDRAARATDQARGPSTPALFRWECGPSGDIRWVEGAPRGALIGRSIASPRAAVGEGADTEIVRAFALRSPFRDAAFSIGGEGTLAGEWIMSGVPAFEPADGRFAGYRGIAQRRGAGGEDVLALPALGDPASLRELVHEIKTPLNAIIGFAEIIDGQYFGPAHSRYRERAAEIVANARSLLEAAEDLDFAAHLQSAQARPGKGTDLKTFLPGFAENLQARAGRHGITLDMAATGATGRLTLDPELTERLLRRFTDAVLSATAGGERLGISVSQARKLCAISITRPQATLMATKDDLLDPEFTLGDVDRALLGLGFSLRLVNGLVGIAGGSLEIGAEAFTLTVPLAKG